MFMQTRRLDEHDGIARGDQWQQSEEGRAIVTFDRQRTDIRYDGERPATEQRLRGQCSRSRSTRWQRISRYCSAAIAGASLTTVLRVLT